MLSLDSSPLPPYLCSFPIPSPPLWFSAPFLSVMPHERGKPSRCSGSLRGSVGHRPSPLPSSNLSDSSLLSSSPTMTQQEDDSWDSWENATLVEEEIPSEHLQENSVASTPPVAEWSPNVVSLALHHNQATTSSSQVPGLLSGRETELHSPRWFSEDQLQLIFELRRDITEQNFARS
jgi:hypothetical protein